MERPSRKRRVCAIAAIDHAGDAVDECNIPKFGDTDSFEYPENTAPGFKAVVEEFKDLFHTSPGVTSEAQHYIPTTGNPVRVPPRRIPAHYRDKVEQQIQEMLERYHTRGCHQYKDCSFGGTIGGGENGDVARLWVISVPCAGGIYTTECKHNQDQANTMLGTCNSLRGETEGGGPHLGSGTGG